MVGCKRTVFFVGLFLLCFLCVDLHGNFHTFFIQTTLDSEVVKDLQESIKPAIEKIIQEELGIKQDKNFPIFFAKRRQAVTVYYVYDLFDSNEPLGCIMYLFVEPAANAFEGKGIPKETAFKPDLKFFGEQKKGLCGSIDLVALIDDPKQELLFFNKELKKSFTNANKEYRRAYGADLYNVAKSEQFPFLPHISLGHLRVNYIKHLVNDPQKADKIIERIKKRIIKVFSTAIGQLPKNERKLSFDSIAIYNAKTRKYIHSREL